ncbi:MAG: hypothetical protein KBD60_01660 [Sterolibacterium sp.]|jgi:hypothetical protein|nr:hypothetical protein [Sterolibacterium sp.]
MGLRRVGIAKRWVPGLLWMVLSAPLQAYGPWRADAQNTRGWQFMSPEERIEHQARMRGFRDADACRAYQLEQHRRMTERAQVQGVTLRPAPRDACAHLPPAEVVGAVGAVRVAP